MSNFITSSKALMIATVIATSAFADCCKPACEPCAPCCVPHELLQCPTQPIYSAPARIDIQCGWDVWGDASFIYWQALQENMNPVVEHTLGVTNTLGTNSWAIPEMGFKFKPGFKVGLGMSFDYDNWDSSIEYTWFRSHDHRNAAMSRAAATAGSGFYPQFADGAVTAPVYGSLVNAFTSFWKLNLNFLDMDLGRWYYLGTQLTVRPSIGARVAWIYQKRGAQYTNVLNPGNFAINSQENSNSSGIGPRFALDTNWMIGSGFRFFGNSEFDVLFTRYYRDSHGTVNNPGTVLILYKKSSDVRELRTHLDLEWGMGWGTYLCCHKWHFDLAASYGFQVFWHQNMNFADITKVTNHGNLYIHGLTLTAKLDF